VEVTLLLERVPATVLGSLEGLIKPGASALALAYTNLGT
jgi:hypothetical protein